MRTVSFALLFLALLSLVSAASPSRRRETNAQRLARGLTPSRPRRFYDASRTSESLLFFEDAFLLIGHCFADVARAAPSSVPGVPGTV